MSQVSDDLQFEHEKGSKGKQLVKKKKRKTKKKVALKLSDFSHIKIDQKEKKLNFIPDILYECRR